MAWDLYRRVRSVGSAQDQIHQASQRIVAEASTPTHSGSHKMFVVGKIGVNIQGEDPAAERYRATQGSPCCGRCHK